MAAFKFNYMMKMLVYTVASLMQMIPLSYNYLLLLDKKKIGKYSVFLVPSVGISIGLDARVDANPV